MIQTSCGMPLSEELLSKYLRSLINLFFKILPIWESGEKTVGVYMQSLQAELLGCSGLVDALHNDPLLLTLLSILQFLIDHPETETAVVRREVFRAISICEKLNRRYGQNEKEGEPA